MQQHMNEILSMNATMDFFTVKRTADGTLIYLVDGLEPGSPYFGYPGSPLESEMVPYVEAALLGQSVYSRDIVDTTWGHIFTACYPVHANDGVVCVEMLEKAPEHYYDLVLMDIQMPVMDGYDATVKIRRMQSPAKARVPIIAMTANAFSEDKNRALAVGMNDHVAKPIDMNVLLPVIIQQLQ